MARKAKSSIHKRASALRKKGTIKISEKSIPNEKTVPVKIRRKISKRVKRPTTRIFHKKTGSSSVEKKLAENFIALQKVMVNLSSKFDNLANQISKLLELFEISAKSLAKKDFKEEKSVRDEERIMQKLDNLGEQNRTIARGLTLMHDRISGQEPPVQRPVPAPPPIRLPAQSPEQRMPTQQGTGMEGYQKSLSSRSTQFKKLPSSKEKEK